jgi:hypothetical protein
MRDPPQKDFARSVTGHECEAVLESGAGLLPLLAAIGGERFVKGIAQLEMLLGDFALAADTPDAARRELRSTNSPAAPTSASVQFHGSPFDNDRGVNTKG